MLLSAAGLSGRYAPGMGYDSSMTERDLDIESTSLHYTVAEQMLEDTFPNKVFIMHLLSPDPRLRPRI